jgi:hypothetical protein
VTLRPTFSKDTRPSNGLEEIAPKLLADNHAVHYVVGVVKFAGGSVDEEGAIVPAVKFLGLEPLDGDLASQAKSILDGARKTRGLGRMEDSIPAQDSPLFDFDGDGKPVVRVGADGEHAVPEPSGEEIVAELDERRAAKSGKATADPFTPGGEA